MSGGSVLHECMSTNDYTIDEALTASRNLFGAAAFTGDEAAMIEHANALAGLFELVAA